LLKIQKSQSENFKIQTESVKNQENINRVIAFTGSIIALVAIYNFIIPNLSFENYPTNLLIIKLVFLLLLFLCIGPLAKVIFNFWKKEVFGR
jgi:antibiotic biosynthesis monooxygenase (ABM) superfamily enzyme